MRSTRAFSNLVALQVRTFRVNGGIILSFGLEAKKMETAYETKKSLNESTEMS